MADRTFYIKKNRDDAIKILQIVINILNEFNIKYYLDFGTLIGAIRDKGLILWDDDIDISLLDEKDYHKIPEVLKRIKKQYKLRTYLFTFRPVNTKKSIKRREAKIKDGLPVYKGDISFSDIDNYRIAKVRSNKFWIFGRGNTCIDIFFKYKYQDKSYWLAYGQENSVPLDYMCDELIEIDFCGLKCTIPKEYDKYLTYKYANWQVPKEDWSHSKDDFSIIK